jgi:LL-diaminopimelate aminotransferase
MTRLNENYLKVEKSYLFTDIEHKVRAFSEAHPDAKIIRMGIGDVTRPLARPVVDSLKAASEEQAHVETFRGYGPEKGYGFLREAIAEKVYLDRGIKITAEDIFISDGAKSDMGNFLDILAKDLDVLIADPVYPVYMDTNIMEGNRIHKLPCLAENDFLPQVPKDQKADLIYICSPNNPTGMTMTREALEDWVSYALEQDAIILFDAAYEAFIQDDSLPRSIYEIPGAEKVAVEVRSFSKFAGFTGLRCGYTVIPSGLMVRSEDGQNYPLADFWMRRQTTKYNGVPYVVQRAAEAAYTDEGYAACMENIRYYLDNAKALKEALEALGLKVYGAENAPYIWAETPAGQTSWEYFDFLLNEAHLVVTPGSGFGACGEGYIRLSAFASHEDTKEAISRLNAIVKN